MQKLHAQPNLRSQGKRKERGGRLFWALKPRQSGERENCDPRCHKQSFYNGILGPSLSSTVFKEWHYLCDSWGWALRTLRVWLPLCQKRRETCETAAVRASTPDKLWEMLTLLRSPSQASDVGGRGRFPSWPWGAAPRCVWSSMTSLPLRFCIKMQVVWLARSLEVKGDEYGSGNQRHVHVANWS